MRRRKLFAALALALVATAIAVPVYATHSTTAPVEATVTPAFLSVTFTGQHLGYGTLDLDAPTALPIDQNGSSNAQAAFVVTNNGTQTASWAIVGAGSGAWGIAGTAAGNTYAQRYAISADGDGIPTPTAISQHQSSTLNASVAANGTVHVWLELDMPTDTAPGTGEQTLPINITASI